MRTMCAKVEMFHEGEFGIFEKAGAQRMARNKSQKRIGTKPLETGKKNRYESFL
jgi:hypothetical protein